MSAAKRRVWCPFSTPHYLCQACQPIHSSCIASCVSWSGGRTLRSHSSTCATFIISTHTTHSLTHSPVRYSNAGGPRWTQAKEQKVPLIVPHICSAPTYHTATHGHACTQSLFSMSFSENTSSATSFYFSAWSQRCISMRVHRCAPHCLLHCFMCTARSYHIHKKAHVIFSVIGSFLLCSLLDSQPPIVSCRLCGDST